MKILILDVIKSFVSIINFQIILWEVAKVSLSALAHQYFWKYVCRYVRVCGLCKARGVHCRVLTHVNTGLLRGRCNKHLSAKWEIFHNSNPGYVHSASDWTVNNSLKNGAGKRLCNKHCFEPEIAIVVRMERWTANEIESTAINKLCGRWIFSELHSSRNKLVLTSWNMLCPRLTWQSSVQQWVTPAHAVATDVKP